MFRFVARDRGIVLEDQADVIKPVQEPMTRCGIDVETFIQALSIRHSLLLEVDLEGWETEYRRHEAVVRGYFARRPGDLLVFNVAGGDGWGPLCEFLGHPVPEAAFPRENVFHPWTPSRASAAAQRR